MSAKNHDRPIDLHNDYFFQYMMACQRALSENHAKPVLQRYVQVGRNTFGPSLDDKTSSSVGIVFDFAGTLVTYEKPPLDSYLDHVHNKELRQNPKTLSDLFHDLVSVIGDYLPIKRRISERLRIAELEREDHVNASKKVVEELNITPNAQYTLQTLRDKWNMRKQYVDTSDFYDIASRVVENEFGIPASDVRASEAIFDGKNRFRDIKPNIRDHKVQNKIEILRDNGVDPKLNIYVADVDTEVGDKFKIKRTDPELPVLYPELPLLSMVGYKISGIFNIAFQRLKPDVIKGLKKSISDQTPLQTNEWKLIEDSRFPYSCVIFGTEVGRDFSLIMQPLIPWEMSMYAAAAFTPETHKKARDKLAEIDSLAKRVISSPSSIQRKTIDEFAHVMQEVNAEYNMGLPFFETRVQQISDEIEEMKNQGKIVESRFRNLADELNTEYDKLIDRNLGKKDLSIMDDIAARYAEKFRKMRS